MFRERLFFRPHDLVRASANNGGAPGAFLGASGVSSDGGPPRGFLEASGVSSTFRFLSQSGKVIDDASYSVYSSLLKLHFFFIYI